MNVTRPEWTVDNGEYWMIRAQGPQIDYSDRVSGRCADGDVSKCLSAAICAIEANGRRARSTAARDRKSLEAAWTTSGAS